MTLYRNLLSNLNCLFYSSSSNVIEDCSKVLEILSCERNGIVLELFFVRFEVIESTKGSNKSLSNTIRKKHYLVTLREKGD